MTIPTSDDIGARLSDAIARSLPERPLVPELDDVRTGARRRHRRTRSLLAASCVALVVIAGLVTVTVARRSSTSPSSPSPSVTPAPIEPPTITVDPVADTTSLLPTYGVLTTATGSLVEPVDANVVGGDTHNDVFATPSVDEWSSGDATVTVRTASLPSAVPDVPEPFDPAQLPVVTEAVDVRGGSGLIAQLDHDQFAVWLPSDGTTNGPLIVGRGLSREELLGTIDAMTDDGTGLVPVGYVPTAQSSASPAHSPRPARSSLRYESGNAVTWISTDALAPDQTTLETATPFSLGRTAVVDGRPAFVMERSGRVTVQWIDPAGVLVSIEADAEGADLDQLAGSVSMVDDATWRDLLHRRTESLLSSTSEIRGAQLGDVHVTLRDGDDQHAVCVALLDGSPACVGSTTDSFGDRFIAGHAGIGDSWILFGSAPSDLSGDEISVTITDLSGIPVDVVTQTDERGSWFAAVVPDDVDVVDVDILFNDSGVGGEWARQPVAVVVLR